MANNTPTKTSFNKDNQPKKGRGKSERTKILDAMKRQAKTEDGFYDELITRAFNPDDNFTFKEVLARMSPIPKAVTPLYEFEFDESGSPYTKSCQIVKAIALGKIPADIGAAVINAIQATIKIQEVTDIDERLKVMEAKDESKDQA